MNLLTVFLGKRIKPKSCALKWCSTVFQRMRIEFGVLGELPSDILFWPCSRYSKVKVLWDFKVERLERRLTSWITYTYKSMEGSGRREVILNEIACLASLHTACWY